LKNGIADLNKGAKTLANGTASLSTGAASLKNGASDLGKGANTAAKGASDLAAGAGALSEGSGKLKNGITDLNNGAKTLANGTASLSTGAASLKNGAADLDKGAGSAAKGASDLETGAGKLTKGSGKLRTGITDLNNGAKTLAKGTKDLKDGAGTLSAGSSKLVSNNDAILSGASSLKDGASKLAKGASSLKNGAADLSEGAATLSDSMPKLVDGTKTLSDGLSTGAAKLEDTNKNDKNAEMFSSPLETTETKITTVNDNGHAMAAYMMSVGLWVACLAFCLMYPLTEHDGLESGFKWWLSKASVLYPMAIVQAVVLVMILHFSLGFEPARLGQTIFVACLASVAFMSIMYFFNVLLGKVGSFLMLIFMVLQLAGSAGTYPIEVSGPLAAALNRFMPFTYTVGAFRSSIGGGEPFPSSVMVLLMIFLVSSLLSVILFVIRGRKEKEGRTDLHKIMEAHGFA
ncbi:MAG: YhgE/Pip family protein, partial [Clostridiales bacterium]|nr:YhgE/Pip family protein [Clostridiales bacterium]